MIPTNHTGIMFSSALLKVASRCNLDCDYCYMYHHADQSWREQPAFMSDQIVAKFADRLAEYVDFTGAECFSVTYHGGEPLLYTAERLAQATQVIKSKIGLNCKLDFSVQTNGVLLTDESLFILKDAGIFISLSLDGPQTANDLHRLDHAGASSFEATLSALERLNADREIFRGVIAVIDPQISASDLFSFFHSYNLPSLDLLLPDATHVRPPQGRDKNLSLYEDWLKNAFNVWFEAYPDMPVRFFDGVLGARLGVPSPTDAMGFGSVSLLVIETDGSYADHDVFRITKPKAYALGYDIFNTSFDEIACHPQIVEHNYRLSLNGIAKECKVCPIVESCGGGSIMHRYHPSRGLDTPTIYCREMFGLVTVANKKLRESLDTVSALTTSPKVLVSFDEELAISCQEWRKQIEKIAGSITSSSEMNWTQISATAILLKSRTTELPLEIINEADYVADTNWLGNISIQNENPWLVAPFIKTIKLLATDSEEYQHGLSLLDTVESYLFNLSPCLIDAIKNLISDILFVEDITDNGGGIFSFSDDSAPNVIYVAPFADKKPLTPDDFTDSILHEFLHQVLYHMERDAPMLYDYDFPRFPAPWRSGLRPAGGFLHGTYVFAGLSRFWAALGSSNLPNVDEIKAESNAQKFRSQALYGINTLNQFALLTPHGRRLIQELASVLEENLSLLEAPGIL